MSSSVVETVIVGAGAAGLMAALTLARAGRRVTVLEARERCGGRIAPQDEAAFGYAADAGAEYIHAAAPITRDLLRQAGLSTIPVSGRRWSRQNGEWVPRDTAPGEDRFLAALKALRTDEPVGAFVQRHFAGPHDEALRQLIGREVEGYNNADLSRFSTFALREQWLDPDSERQDRVVEGYGALVDFLAAECRQAGVAIHLGAVVTAVEAEGETVTVRCRDGVFTGGQVLLTLPLPVLRDLALPPALRGVVAAADAAIGFGAVVKTLLRFREPWWRAENGGAFADMGSVFGAGLAVPVWWTQYPMERAVLTGWLSGAAMGEAAGLPEEMQIERGLASLAQLFAKPVELLKGELLAARAVNWGGDPFARGAYSYPTVKTSAALAGLRAAQSGTVRLCGEALVLEGETGTVEAALASGQETARLILGI